MNRCIREPAGKGVQDKRAVIKTGDYLDREKFSVNADEANGTDIVHGGSND